jgi:hypothetical protein
MDQDFDQQPFRVMEMTYLIPIAQMPAWEDTIRNHTVYGLPYAQHRLLPRGLVHVACGLQGVRVSFETPVGPDLVANAVPG